MKEINLKIIIGSTRQNRFSEKPAKWVFDEISNKTNVDTEILDLRDYPMPFFDEPISPSNIKEPYKNEVVAKWREKIKEADAFLVITPEYNHGYPAVLKNALDYVFYEWHGKPIGFVSYGSVGGARSVEQLKQVVIELNMIPVRNSIHIPWNVLTAVREKDDLTLFEPFKSSLHRVVDELIKLGGEFQDLHHNK